MKKTILAIGAALAVAISAQAAVDYTHTLVANMNDGTQTKFEFQDIPVATIEGEDLMITLMTTMDSYAIPMSELVNITIDRQESGVKGIEAESNAVRFGLTHDQLEVWGLPEATDVTVTDINGILQARGTASADGYAAVAIGELGKGVYIVKAGKNGFKFIR